MKINKVYNDDDWIKLGIGCGVLLFIAPVVLGLNAFILQLVWNAFVPSIFGLPALTFWQSVAASVLLTVLGSYFKPTTKVK